MFALGCGLVVAGILLTGFTMLLFRRPEPPRWSRPELVAMLVTVPLTGIIGVGLGYMLVGGYRLLHGAGELYELAAPFAVALLVAGVWRLLGIRRRLQAYSAASPPPGLGVYATMAPTLAVGEPAPPRSPKRPTQPSSRKAA
jgi:hypothetical protein